MEACLQIRCLAMDVILLRALAPAETFLPSRCLAMGLYVAVVNIFEKESMVQVFFLVGIEVM
jgi:hypothetical protein